MNPQNFLTTSLFGIGLALIASSVTAEEFNPSLSQEEVADLQALFDCMDGDAKSDDVSIGCLQPVIAIIGPESNDDYEFVAEDAILQ